jgi:acyl transferase domain-containing protein
MGRDAMPARMGFIANSLDSIKTKVSRFLVTQFEESEIQIGEINDTHSVLEYFHTKSTALRNEVIDLKEVLSAWIKGYEIDWRKLYKTLPRRMHLPGYPFAGDRCWIDDTYSTNFIPSKVSQANLAQLGSNDANGKRLDETGNYEAIEDVISKLSEDLLDETEAVKLLSELI